MTAWKHNSRIELREIDNRVLVFAGCEPTSKRGKHHYCYVIRAPAGNLMVHPPDAPSFYRDCGERIDAWGGVARIFFTHHGDASASCKTALGRWRAAVYAHLEDAPAIRRKIEAADDGDVETFVAAHALGNDIDVVTLPGHTAGYSGLIARLPSGVYFFAGHLIVRSKLGWQAAASAERFRDSVATVRRISELDVDFLMPEVTWDDAPEPLRAPLPFGASERRDAIASALEYLDRKVRAAKRSRATDV